jgi:hypothetical protein
MILLTSRGRGVATGAGQPKPSETTAEGRVEAVASVGIGCLTFGALEIEAALEVGLGAGGYKLAEASGMKVASCVC